MYAFYKLYYRNCLEKYSIRNSDGAAQQDSILFFRTELRKESDNEFFYGYSFQPILRTHSLLKTIKAMSIIRIL